jgi:hypothetical protein
MKSKVMVALLICGLSVGVFAANVLATPSSGVTTKILAKSLFDEFAVNAPFASGGRLASAAQDSRTV